MTCADIVPFVPAGKIRCFVTKKLRKDTPEGKCQAAMGT